LNIKRGEEKTQIESYKQSTNCVWTREKSVVYTSSTTFWINIQNNNNNNKTI